MYKLSQAVSLPQARDTYLKHNLYVCMYFVLCTISGIRSQNYHASSRPTRQSAEARVRQNPRLLEHNEIGYQIQLVLSVASASFYQLSLPFRPTVEADK